METNPQANQAVNMDPTQPLEPTAGTVPPWIASPNENIPPSGRIPKPRIPEVKKSPFAFLVPFLGLLILGFGLYFLTTKVFVPLAKRLKANQQGNTNQNEATTLTYWGLWEPKEIMEPLIADYQKLHPQITINYIQQSHKDYRERLQSALALDDGPDIFRFHLTWMPMLKRDLAFAPGEIKQVIKLAENYYPAASKYLEIGGQLFGVPLGFDSLALFYNPKMLQDAQKEVPNTWDELRRTAVKLTVYDKTGKIQTAGVALGTVENVDHFSDILGLMMLQNGVDLSKPSGVLAEDALKFYTIFRLTDKVWDETLPNSTYAFATGKVAMMFAPSWRAYEISQINPELEYKTSPVPQLSGTKISWATFWVEGVNAKSKKSAAAWEFLQYLSSKESLTAFYAQASKARKFGEPYPRIDLASQLENDSIVGSFVKQGSSAQSWYLCSGTYDNGINDKMIKYFTDAVNSVLKGENPTDALNTAALGVAQVLGQYEIK